MFEKSRYQVIAALVGATAIVAPQSLAGWTATVKSGQLRYKFAVEDNAFILRVRPVGLVLLVR